MSPETLAASAVVIACTYLIFGMTGFGSTALAVPLLVHLVPLRYLVPLLALLDLLAALLVSVRARKGVRWDEMRRIVPAMVFGSAGGALLLARAPEQSLLIVLGVLLVGYAAFALLRRGGPPKFSSAWGAPTGLSAGLLASLYGNGGLVTAVYISGRIHDKDGLRATAAAIVVVNASVRTVFFAATGLLTQEALLLSAALLVPSLLLGLALGGRLHAAVPARLVLKTVYLVIGAAGVLLLARQLARLWT
ncbi:MAG: TSUP family transporter [Burkholderiales bacterium]